MIAEKTIILTGDRPTGCLHLGHYAGSLQQRVRLQDTCEQYVMVADLQAMTHNAEHIELVRRNIVEVAIDNLAVGVDPNKTTFCVQSLIPELSELFFYYMNLVTLARLQRNPTIKTEMKEKGFGDSVAVGFLCHPVSQAADITGFGATLVPVGEDQVPLIEQTVEIVRTFNRTYGDILVEPRATLSNYPRLPGLDGNSKMGKSLGNVIYLSESEKGIKEKVKTAFTDPLHLRVKDPGHLEGNVVFSYLDAFDLDREGLEKLKENYVRGGVSDGDVKERLSVVLGRFIGPIRERRAEIARDRGAVISMLKEHSAKARQVVTETLRKVREAVQIEKFY